MKHKIIIFMLYCCILPYITIQAQPNRRSTMATTSSVPAPIQTKAQKGPQLFNPNKSSFTVQFSFFNPRTQKNTVGSPITLPAKQQINIPRQANGINVNNTGYVQVLPSTSYRIGSNGIAHPLQHTAPKQLQNK